MAPDVSYTLVSDLVTVYLLQFLSDKCNQDISLYCRNQKKRKRSNKVVMTILHGVLYLACEKIRFSSLFASEDVSRETSPAANSEEKRIFSQAILC